MNLYFFIKNLKEYSTLFLAELLYLLRMTEIMRLFNSNKTIILMYHGVSNKNFSRLENFDGKHVDVNKFSWQMQHVKSRYNILSLREYVTLLKNKRKIPRNSLIITFDDGYKNFYHNVYSILKKHNFPATIFPIADFIGSKKVGWFDQVEHLISNTTEKKFEFRLDNKKITYLLNGRNNRVRAIIEMKDLIKKLDKNKQNEVLKTIKMKLNVDQRYPDNYKYITWEQLEEISNNKIEVGGHTRYHDLLTTLSDVELKEDLHFCRRLFKKKLNIVLDLFAYPKGDHDERVKNILKQNRFICAVTTIDGVNGRETDLFALKRVGINNHIKKAEFVWKLVNPFNR